MRQATLALTLSLRCGDLSRGSLRAVEIDGAGGSTAINASGGGASTHGSDRRAG